MYVFALFFVILRVPIIRIKITVKIAYSSAHIRICAKKATVLL